MRVAAGAEARPFELALAALLVIVLGLISVGQGYVYRRHRSRGKEPLLPAWAPGGWWPRHPTATLRAGWATTVVGIALLILAAYQQLSA
ncbi:hypothetical protein KBX37_06605 [Micromonospora sp. U56]|uniref:hypothetical protein n=1 Tax=Micromonospora sp. U56 TaxID=2824900 RepID=UPI001B35D88A|nr:hypothetical protein [Micromonospora sp. U56]MBQ0892774.1 hypothetical protein [Micromonospora sp. U56]